MLSVSSIARFISSRLQRGSKDNEFLERDRGGNGMQPDYDASFSSCLRMWPFRTGIKTFAFSHTFKFVWNILAMYSWVFLSYYIYSNLVSLFGVLSCFDNICDIMLYDLEGAWFFNFLFALQWSRLVVICIRQAFNWLHSIQATLYHWSVYVHILVMLWFSWTQLYLPLSVRSDFVSKSQFIIWITSIRVILSLKRVDHHHYMVCYHHQLLCHLNQRCCLHARLFVGAF